MELLDPVLLSRIQFAFVISFHIIFPSLTIGLASFLAVLEGLWLKTKHPVYKEIYKFWVKIFAVCFGLGVVSGVVMSYQFGMNWSGFSAKVGNVLGPLLSFEVLTAFFLEASFLGIMLFAWDRVSPRVHFISTLVVAIGTIISAFWILSANSWMQTPQGFTMKEDGIFHPTDWMEIIFNPSFPYRFFHMLTAAYLTTSFIVAGVAAWYLLKDRYTSHARIMLTMAMLMAILVAPMQIMIGDMHGLNTLKHQPAKIAAIEGLWETEKGAGLKLFGWPDQEKEETLYSIEIPKLGSIILAHDIDAEIKGLKHWPKEQRTDGVALVFWCFRIMVGVGLIMSLTGVLAIIQYARKKIFTSKPFLKWCIMVSPLGILAILCGWITTEVGRQPYVVYGVMKTIEAHSPVTVEQVLIALIAFFVVYAFVFGAGVYYIFKLISKGVKIGDWIEMYGKHGQKHPISIADIFPKTF
ncbi:cytochrome ubiquinol oxidase subunit I [Holosporaceae bacterium 'Namur']|nr:cytochrome ubiquinol oxidase subunit I [Holosporaceae bacterium 'Namur']